MKVAPVLAAALVIYIAIPGSNQGKGKKPKPKFCRGANGNQYKKGESYEDEEACIRYTCRKKGKTFKMKEEKIQCTESEPDLAANMTAIEASMKLLNGSMESMETKLEDLQSNVESLQSNVESLQTSVESILGMMTAMQSTSSKLEVNITSNMDAISSNKKAISSNKNTCSAIETTAAQLVCKCTSLDNKVDISTNNNGINTNKDTCSAIETTTAKLETCLGDVDSTDCPSSEDGKISMVDAIKGNKEDIEALEKPKFNLVLTGGYNFGGRLTTSEIISPGGVCSQGIPPFPVAVWRHNSVYFNNTLMVCGGKESGGYTKKCYQLRDSNSEWTEGPAMNTPRSHFSMTKVGQDLYALGGYNGGDLDSMEKLSESSGEWTLMAQKLTSPRGQHCTVFMETTRSLVTIGGYPTTNLVEEFSVATATWKELAPLPVALYGHGCVVLGHSIVVTGGYSNSGAYQKKVYTFAGGQWATTGELQQTKFLHSMGTLDNKVLVLGGHNGGAPGYVDTIEEMQQDGSFRIMEKKLHEKRGYSTATQVPREMFPCL